MSNPMILARGVSRGFALLACLALAVAVAAADAGAKSGKQASGEPEERAVGLNRQVAEKLGKAIELFESDRFDEALAIVDELAKKRRLKPPDIAQIHRFRGYIFVSKGHSEDATQEFEKALAEHALDRFAEQQTTYSLAQLYTQLGSYDSALAADRRLVRRRRESDARRLLPEGDDPRAAGEVRGGTRARADRRRNDGHAARELGAGCWSRSYIQLQDYENVATNLERLIGIAPDKKQYWVQLAAVQNHLKQDAQALATLRLANEAGLLDDDRDLPAARAPAVRARAARSSARRRSNRAIDSGVVQGRRRFLSDAVELLHRRARARSRARAAREGRRARAGRRDVHAARPDAPPARALRAGARGAARRRSPRRSPSSAARCSS